MDAHALQNTSEKYNTRINTKKTKLIRISQVEGRPIMVKTWKKWNSFVTLEVWWLKTVEVVVKWDGELHWEKKPPIRKRISCRNLSAFICENLVSEMTYYVSSGTLNSTNSTQLICENVWWKYLSGLWSVVLYGSETWTLYKKRIFGDLKHLKCGYGGVWWKYRGLSTNKWRNIANGRHRKRNDGHS